MKLSNLIIVLLIGVLTVFLELQPYSDIGDDILIDCLIVVIIVLALVYLIRAIQSFKAYGKRIAFMPFLASIVILVIIYTHILYRDAMVKSKSLLVAHCGEKIEGREVTNFDFKSNGYLRIEAVYKFSDSYFFGSYRKQGDTLLLNIKTNFRLSKEAIIKGDTLQFVGDTAYYFIDHSFS